MVARNTVHDNWFDRCFCGQDCGDACMSDDEPWERYPLVSSAELSTAVKPVRWIVRGVWPEKSAGAWAGKKKAFKTWAMHSLGVSVATQLSYLDEYPVDTSGPVLYLTGEGGRDEFKSRHHAIAKRYGINRDGMRDIAFHAMFDVAPLDDRDFTDALKHHLDTVQPVLVIIDPLYAYHPQGVEAANVYSRGPMLAAIRAIIEPYSALIIGDHINKSADDRSLDLDDIGFSGVSQWVDSWSLQRHREVFRSCGPESYAKLEVEYGSRRAGSMRYNVDWTLIRDTDDPHVIKWDSCDWAVLKGAAAAPVTATISNREDAYRQIQNYVDAHPDTAKTSALTALREQFTGYSRDQWRELWDNAIREHYIEEYVTTEEQPYRKSTRLVEIHRFKRGREVGTGGHGGL